MTIHIIIVQSWVNILGNCWFVNLAGFWQCKIDGRKSFGMQQQCNYVELSIAQIKPLFAIMIFVPES